MTTEFTNKPSTLLAGEPQQLLHFGPSSDGQEPARSGDAGSNSTGSGAKPNRLFFPSNREDILLQMSSLAISKYFPAGVTALPVHDGALALLPDGLRADEITLLQGERLGRFPVLVELRESVCDSSDVLGIKDVLALHFRSQREADDFRFRPVEEINTEEMICRVDPGLFGLPGAARFSNSAQGISKLQGRGHYSDRIAGGVCSLLELGAASATCWREIADLLCLSNARGSPQEVTLSEALASGAASSLNDAQAALVFQEFIAHVPAEPRSALVSKIHAQLIGATEDAGQIRKLERWYATANAVLQNQARITGELLSDEGSVVLRAALLACVADDMRALIPFMLAPKPAGRKVIVAAAFLIGLRTGVTDMPWTMKRAHLDILSPLIVTLQRAAPEASEEVVRAFQIEPDETPAGVILRLLWGNHEVACWTPNEGDESHRADSIRHESADVGDASRVARTQLAPQLDETRRSESSTCLAVNAFDNDGRNCIHVHDGRNIEILRMEPPLLGVTMRCSLIDTDRLRKSKEILESACIGGLLWRVGVSSEGTAALYADLSEWPDESMLAVLTDALARALDVYLVKKKTRAAVSKRRVKSGVGKSSGEPAS